MGTNQKLIDQCQRVFSTFRERGRVMGRHIRELKVVKERLQKIFCAFESPGCVGQIEGDEPSILIDTISPRQEFAASLSEGPAREDDYFG
jgi:hypothetical protein